jgi:hypothetical protein
MSKTTQVVIGLLVAVALVVMGVSAGLVIAGRTSNPPTQLAMADTSQGITATDPNRLVSVEQSPCPGVIFSSAVEAKNFKAPEGMISVKDMDGNQLDPNTLEPISSKEHEDPYSREGQVGNPQSEEPDEVNVDLQDSDNTNRTGKYNTKLNFDPPFNNSPAGVICAYFYVCTRGETEKAYGYWLADDPTARVVSSGIATADLCTITANLAGANLNSLLGYKCEVEVDNDLADVEMYYRPPGGGQVRDYQRFTVRKLDGRWKIISVFVA